MAVFDVAQSVVNQSASIIISDAGIDISSVVGNLETTLADWSIGSLLDLWVQNVFVGLCAHILTIAIFLVTCGRMTEVYCGVDPVCRNGQPGMWPYRAELLEVLAGAGLSIYLTQIF